MSLYDREMDRYRETLRLDSEVAQERYGMTLLHSLSPAEKVLALKDMGRDISDPADYYNLGHVNAVEQNWDDAIGYFRRAIELDPTMADAIYNLAYCYEQAGLAPQAKATWQLFLDVVDDKELKKDIKEHLKTLG